MYRVDNVPSPVRPFFLGASYGIAYGLIGLTRAIGRSCSIAREGLAEVDPERPTIFCSWHDAVVPLLCTLPILPDIDFRRQVWMNHPAYYMKPIHLVAAHVGIRELVLGSSGNGGRLAADVVASKVRAGASTWVFPDGPAGPHRVLKRGVLHLARRSGAPIVPFSFATPRAFVLPGTWDGKRFPLPGSRIVVRVGAPLHVREDAATDEDLDACASELTRAMSWDLDVFERGDRGVRPAPASAFPSARRGR